MILVTGGAGFIGANFIQKWFKTKSEPLVNVDSLTYAGSLLNLKEVESNPNYFFEKTDILDSEKIGQILEKYKPKAIVHFAAESHVDRSIHNPELFLNTNIIGSFRLLESTKKYLQKNPNADFKFIHVSTDEVFGSLELGDSSFTEETSYAPNSPYSASKASSDHFARAFFQTYGVPTIVTNCSNNYGPYQHPEKLIPLMIIRALNDQKLPIYGNGQNIRDWLFVEDHCEALIQVLNHGTPGERYNIGGNVEKTNLELVTKLMTILDELKPRPDGKSYQSQISFVEDRLGHDLRYSVSAKKLKEKLNWSPSATLDVGLKKTVQWYLDHLEWVNQRTDDNYKSWNKLNYR